MLSSGNCSLISLTETDPHSFDAYIYLQHLPILGDETCMLAIPGQIYQFLCGIYNSVSCSCSGNHQLEVVTEQYCGVMDFRELDARGYYWSCCNYLSLSIIINFGVWSVDLLGIWYFKWCIYVINTCKALSFIQFYQTNATIIFSFDNYIAFASWSPSQKRVPIVHFFCIASCVMNETSDDTFDRAFQGRVITCQMQKWSLVT